VAPAVVSACLTSHVAADDNDFALGNRAGWSSGGIGGIGATGVLSLAK
jgi:hypothetical protein